MDWALNGLITRLIRDGRVTGEYFESTLILPKKLVACDKLLIFGMGRFEKCLPERIQEVGHKLFNILVNLRVRDISFSFQMPSKDLPAEIFAESFTKGYILSITQQDQDLQEFAEKMNLAVSTDKKLIDKTLLGVQKAKVSLERHFKVMVLE